MYRLDENRARYLPVLIQVLYFVAFLSSHLACTSTLPKKG